MRKSTTKSEITGLTTFINSDTYLRHKDFINEKGQMDLNNVQYKEVENNKEIYDLFIVSIVNNNKIVGKLEILDLKATNFLPNNDKFALNYADLSEYDLQNENGKIQLIDLNYDNFVHSNIIIRNGIYNSYISTGLSPELKSKYENIVNRRAPQNVSCDGNGNGNVSYSECYRCISVAIQMNSTSTAICEAFHAAGLPWWGSCMVSTAAACVVISSIY